MICEVTKMEDINVPMMREVLCGLIGRQITCPECGEILDAPAAVAVLGPTDNKHVSCTRCWNKAPMLGFVSGDWMVLDGRALWPRKVCTPKRRVRRGKQA